LTAPESFVLRYAPTTRVGAEAFKLALQELVVRGALRLRPVRVPRVLGLGGRNRWLITEGPMFGGCTESALVPVLEVYRSTPHRRLQVAAASGAAAECEGIFMESFLRTARKALGSYRGYVERHVAVVLEQRGLITICCYVGVCGRTRYFYTAAGRRADEELEYWLQQGKSGGGRAAMRGAGAAILLLQLLHPELRAVDRLLGARRIGAAEPGDPTAGPAVLSDPPGDSKAESGLNEPTDVDAFSLEQLDIPSLDGLAFELRAIDRAIPAEGQLAGPPVSS